METGSTEMGKKSIIPYALYRAEGYVSAALANKVTNLSDDDLDLLWTALRRPPPCSTKFPLISVLKRFN